MSGPTDNPGDRACLVRSAQNVRIRIMLVANRRSGSGRTGGDLPRGTEFNVDGDLRRLEPARFTLADGGFEMLVPGPE